MAYWSNFYKPQGITGKIILMRMNLQHKAKAKWVLSLLNIDKVQTVLDIGCGGGGFLNYVLKQKKEIKAYGLDHSEVSVRVAIKQNKKYIHSRCVIVTGSVSHIPFNSESFDLVTAFSAIYYWPHIKKDMEEVYRVLSVGGIVAIDCTLFEFVNTDIGRKYKKRISGFRLYEIGDILQILNDIGFKDIQVHKEKYPFRICIIASKL